MLTSLFGLRINSGEYARLINDDLIGQANYYCFLNSHMLYEYQKTHRLKEVLDAGEAVILPDGMPILLSLKWIRHIKADRIAGNDVMFSLIQKAQQEQLRIYLIGGMQKTLDNISVKLLNLKINHKTYSPPFRPIEEFDFRDQSDRINEFAPDLILVGLGCPKQELWMYNMRNLVKAPMFGLGGAFALFAGIDSRAPKWMRSMALEWLYRLALEPGRLWKRYLVTNSYFIYLLLREFWRVRIRKLK